MAEEKKTKKLVVEPPQVGTIHLRLKGQDQLLPCVEILLTSMSLRIREESGEAVEESLCIPLEGVERLAHDLLEEARRLKNLLT